MLYPCPISTDEQTEYSPDAQLRAIREYCKRNDFVLQENHIYADEGISGRTALKRPQFQKMISIAKLNAKSPVKDFDVIIVHKFDRFARSREDSVVYKSLLRKECGIKVVSVTENIEDDKFSVILEAMLEAMAEYYSLNLSEEVKKGMTEKALRGEPLTIPPYGYIMENKQLIPDAEQADIIKDIYKSFLDGQGYMKIAKKLNNLDIRTNRGGRFENRTIEYILRNPVYCGKIRWNPKRRTRRDYDDENLLIVQGSHEPLISEEIFSKVQDRVMELKEKHVKYSKAEHSSHWLVGLLKCSSCGKGLVKNGTKYLQCRGYVGGACGVSHSITIEEAERLVLKRMEEDAAGIEFVAVAVRNKTIDRPYAEKRLVTLQRRLDRAKDAYSAGVDSLEEYKATKDRITREMELLEHEIKTPHKEEKTVGITALGLIKAAERLRSDLPLSMKKEIAKKIIHNIVYDKLDKTLYITYNNQ